MGATSCPRIYRTHLLDGQATSHVQMQQTTSRIQKQHTLKLTGWEHATRPPIMETELYRGEQRPHRSCGILLRRLGSPKSQVRVSVMPESHIYYAPQSTQSQIAALLRAHRKSVGAACRTRCHRPTPDSFALYPTAHPGGGFRRFRALLQRRIPSNPSQGRDLLSSYWPLVDPVFFSRT
jgi:hypothetical protein